MAGRSIRDLEADALADASVLEKVRKGYLRINRKLPALERMIMAIPMWK